MKDVGVWFKGVNLDDFYNKVEMLFHLGHAIGSSFPDTSEECKKAFVDECKNESSVVFQLATTSLQKYSDLKTDADFGPKTKDSVKNRFCPLPDIQPLAAQGASYWGFHDLIVWHDMDGLSSHDEKVAYLEACSMIAKYTPLTFTWWVNDAVGKPNIYAHARRIDGPGKTLAWSYKPSRNANRNEQIEQRYDKRENWTELWRLISTMCHELLHAVGLDHSSNPTDLMYHTINGIREPAVGDIAAMRVIYGSGSDSDNGNGDFYDELVSSKVLGRVKDGRYLVVEHSLRKSV